MKISIRYLMLCIAKRLAIPISVCARSPSFFPFPSFTRTHLESVDRLVGRSAGFATKERYNTKTTHSTRKHTRKMNRNNQRFIDKQQSKFSSTAVINYIVCQFARKLYVHAI